MNPNFANALGPMSFPSIEENTFTSNFHTAVQELMKDPTAPKHEQELLKSFMAWKQGAASAEGWEVMYLRFAGRGGISREEEKATKEIGEAVMEFIKKRIEEKSAASGAEHEKGSETGPKEKGKDVE